MLAAFLRRKKLITYLFETLKKIPLQPCKDALPRTVASFTAGQGMAVALTAGRMVNDFSPSDLIQSTAVSYALGYTWAHCYMAAAPVIKEELYPLLPKGTLRQLALVMASAAIPLMYRGVSSGAQQLREYVSPTKNQCLKR